MVDVSLPAWLIEPEAIVQKLSSTADTSSAETTQDSDIVRIEVQGDRRLRPNPVTQIGQLYSLDDMRDVIGKIREERKTLRRKCSIVAFEQLLRSGCNTDKILEFLGDRVLNQRGARNLTFLVAYFLESSRVEEMRILCKWVARQLHVGRYSDSALLMISQSLFNIRHQGEWQSVLDDFCECIVQALQSSPVVRTEYLKYKTWSGFVGILFHDVYSNQMIRTGLEFVKTSSTAQLNCLIERLWPIVEHWLHTWEPSRAAELSQITLASNVVTLLQALPQDRRVEAVSAISWRFLDVSLLEEDSRTLWQRHSIWWSAVRSPTIFQHIRRSDSWLKITRALQNRQDKDIQVTAILEIRKHLEQGNLRAAHRLFLGNPQLSLAHCPDLAEALILDSERNAKAALGYLHTQNPLVLTAAYHTGEGHLLKNARQDRINLLERMALAYAKMPHARPSFAFRCVYDCWSLFKRDKLGHVSSGLANAIIESGIVRPLLTLRRLVSHARLEWILEQVAEAEGREAATKLGTSVWRWREDMVWQMEHQRDNKRQGAIAQQWQEQGSIRPDPGQWGTLTGRTAFPKHPLARHQDPLQDSPSITQDHAVGSPLGDLVHKDCSHQRGADTDFENLHKQASPSTNEEEDMEENANVTEFTDLPPPEVHDMDCKIFEKGSKETLEQEWRHEQAFTRPNEASKHVAHHMSYDIANKPSTGYGIAQTSRVPCTTSIDLAQLAATTIAPLDPIPTSTAVRDTPGGDEQHQAHTVDSLLFQLNASSVIGFPGPSTPKPLQSRDLLPELSPISPCSLGAAIATSSGACTDDVPGKQEERGLRIRRLVGTGTIPGMIESEEPTTLSTASQPALGFLRW